MREEQFIAACDRGGVDAGTKTPIDIERLPALRGEVDATCESDEPADSSRAVERVAGAGSGDGLGGHELLDPMVAHHQLHARWCPAAAGGSGGSSRSARNQAFSSAVQKGSMMPLLSNECVVARSFD
jgi:hypothetical protein